MAGLVLANRSSWAPGAWHQEGGPSVHVLIGLCLPHIYECPTDEGQSCGQAQDQIGEACWEGCVTM